MEPKQQNLDFEKAQQRRCHKCSSNMQVVEKIDQDPHIPWSEKGFDFYCNQCDETVYVGSTSSAFFGFVSGGITAVALLFYSADILDFVSFSFAGTFMWKLVALGLSLVFLAFCYGAYSLLKDSFSTVIQQYKYPLQDKQFAIKKLMLNLALGILPLVFALTLGYLNDTYFELDRDYAYFLIPVIFSPILLAPKFNTTWTGVFLATVFWFAFGGILFWY